MQEKFVPNLRLSFDNCGMSSSPPIAPAPIVLTTLNAKYIHASLGLRYLLANMGDLRAQTVLREFTIARQPQDVIDELLNTLNESPAPRIVGFGVYIWNVVQTTAVVRLLKATRPEITIVLGGPEVSYETTGQEIVALADYVITGWGDLAFAGLCRALLNGAPPIEKMIASEQAPLAQIALPYGEYTDDDLAHRLLYVEASRGCPFKCEFCLSALDKTARAFNLPAFLAEMETLIRRGARHFKFVDRTFNLKIDASAAILQFFLDRLASSGDDLFLHFELVPDHLSDRLKQLIAQFPPGVLQFEVGVQSFNTDVQQRISRRQDNGKTETNLRWLLNESNAHVHADLIFGLPGETLESFAAGFDRLYALRPHEIQLGLLKRLRGAPIARHTDGFGMVYDENPPYTVRQTGVLDAATVQRFIRFSRYWDSIANSGRFKQSLNLLLASSEASPSPFAAFLAWTDWLWQRSGKTSGFSPESLVDALFDYLCTRRGINPDTVRDSLLADYLASGARGSPQTLKGLLPKRNNPFSQARPLMQRQTRQLAVRQGID